MDARAARLSLASLIAAMSMPVHADSAPTTIDFAPLTMVGGQGARINVANLSPPVANPVPCNVNVAFLGAEGQPYGAPQDFQVGSGQSLTFQALLPVIDPPGPGQFGSLLLHAVIKLPQQPCHVHAVLETYDNGSGATLSVEQGAVAHHPVAPPPARR
jgi:hypothetical protein